MQKQRQYDRLMENCQTNKIGAGKSKQTIADHNQADYNEPTLKSRQIRKQKMHTNNQCVKNRDGERENESAYTPQNFSKTEKNQKGIGGRHKTVEVQSFKMDESNFVREKRQEKCSEMTIKDLNLKSDQIYLNKGKLKKQQFLLIQDQIIQDKKQSLPNNQYGNGTLNLNDGWKYKGQYVAGIFHGHGQLYENDQLIYSGQFQYGYFHGRGKLQQHIYFNYLVEKEEVIHKLLKYARRHNKDYCDQYNWIAYFGQFKKGTITGYGQLWMTTGEKVISKWEKGVPHKKHTSVVDDTSG